MKQTNKGIKYIKSFSIMIVTLLLSFTIMTQKTYAYVVVDDVVVMSYDHVYRQPEMTEIAQYALRFRTYLPSLSTATTLTDLTELVDYMLTESDTSTSFIATWDYVSENTYGVMIYINNTAIGIINNAKSLKVFYDTNTTVYTIAFYDSNGSELDKLFYILDFQLSDILEIRVNRFIVDLQSYQFGYDNGFDAGYDSGFSEGYSQARQAYGYYNISTGQYETAQTRYNVGYNLGNEAGLIDGYNNGYLVGYDDGLNDNDAYNLGYQDGILSGTGYQQGYDLGYIDGSNDSFLASIKDWIVPAIILVLFLGGVVSIILRKREG